MASDPLADARTALATGKAALAVELAWEAVRPAVIAQDNDVLRSAMQIAEEAATVATGSVRDDAETLASYCAACIIRPRDAQPSPWSMKRLFSLGTDKKTCPDCAETIRLEAKVCRYCGYRFPQERP